MKSLRLISQLAVLVGLFCCAVVAGDAEVPTTPVNDTNPIVATPPVPPSPSTAPGIRIWPDPHFTHWPAIAYGDESRNIAFALPVRKGGVAGSVGWKDQTPLPITLPTDAESISGLLPLPLTIAEHVAIAELGEARYPMRVRVVEARNAWPIIRLENGFPIDESGTPVVIVDRRRGTREERMWALLDGIDARPSGRAIIVGDPMLALGQSAWTGVNAEQRQVHDERYPQHAVLVALAHIFTDQSGPSSLPRTVVWCPGNQVLYGAAWSAEEERVLGTVRTRCEHLGKMPRLILCLPPLPVEDHLLALAEERRELLQRSASRMGWIVVDFARAAGPAAQANAVSPGVFTRYPHGEALGRMRTVLAAALER